ncbi:hypothetical protein [Burkholderia anthina]|uniref:hypothetical protein n=1 Tax=Burkholderia anthina TaxID=179879 RepID=UPI0015888D64|nr:hypothetical protein [Burkholderia anthina]
MDTILTKERRSALNGLIAHWISEQDPEGRALDTLDYFDVDKIDELIDEAIAPAIADAVVCASADLAPSDAAGAPTVPQAVLDALRFYAHGHHYNIDDDHQSFDTVSGEPPNWLHSERDDDCTMIEDGSIARAALCGSIQGFEEPTEPVEGEVLRAAPVAPAAAAPSGEREDWLDEVRRAIRVYAHACCYDKASVTASASEIEKLLTRGAAPREGGAA